MIHTDEDGKEYELVEVSPEYLVNTLHFKAKLFKKEYIKPKPKKIDWSKVADGNLVKYDSDSATPFIFSQKWMATIDDMRRMVFYTTHWHAWRGGECPLPEGVKVEVEFRLGTSIKTKAKVMATEMIWERTGSPSDIIAYRITGLADGWEY